MTGLFATTRISQKCVRKPKKKFKTKQNVVWTNRNKNIFMCKNTADEQVFPKLWNYPESLQVGVKRSSGDLLRVQQPKQVSKKMWLAAFL